MLPILLDLKKLRVALVGNGKAALRRLALLDADGAEHVAVYGEAPSMELADAAGERLRRAMPSTVELAKAQIVFAADLPESRLLALAATVRTLGTLLHVEDRPELGALHAPSILRRGDLVVAVSTNGRSPALARRVKRFLEGVLGDEWQGRLDALGALRARWREAGAGAAEISRWTDEWVDRQRWLGEADAPRPEIPLSQAG